MPDRRNRELQMCGEQSLTGHVAQERPHRRNRIATAGSGQFRRAQRDIGSHMLGPDHRPARIGISKRVLDAAADDPSDIQCGWHERHRERFPDTDQTPATGRDRAVPERRQAATRPTLGADPEGAEALRVRCRAGTPSNIRRDPSDAGREYSARASRQ